jgi:alkylhydroperoxidase/carboxymuconolactone decarboxylase family protein YurZ
MAREQGVTEAELIEFLEVAMTMQGCPGEEWALKALAAYRGEEAAAAGDPICCAH